MKHFILGGGLALLVLAGQGQTLAEWTQQSQTQREYYLQQLAALEVFSGYLAKGYEIAHEGLQTIHAIRHGDYQLHETFFKALQKISPGVQQYAGMEAYIGMQVKSIQLVVQVTALVQESDWLSALEKKYLIGQLAFLRQALADDLDQLSAFNQENFLEMDDADRLRWQQRCGLLAQGRWAMLNRLASGVMVLASQRRQEAAITKLSVILNGIK